MSDASSTFRNTVVMASGTLVSRVTGFLAAISVAAVLGQGTALPNAYQAANEVPNTIFELLIGGVIGAALLPALVRMRGAHDQSGQNAVGTVLIAAGGLLTVAAVFAAPAIASVLTLAEPGLQDGTTLLLRWLLVEIFGYGVMAYAAALLQAHGRFSVVAFAPALNNLVVIVTMLIVRDRISSGVGRVPLVETPGIHGLAFGTAVGVLLVAAVMLAEAMRTTGFRFTTNWRHPSLRSLRSAAGWTTGFVACNLIAAQVVAILAQGTEGGASTYLNAFRLFQLPHGLIAVSIITVLAPALARVGADRDALARQTTDGLRILLVGMVGASAMLVVLATPIASLFRQGEFDNSDVADLAEVLRAFGFGLPAFSAYLFLLRAYYAQRDARTPFILNLGENALNIALAILLVNQFETIGLAASYSAAYAIAAVVTYVRIQNDIGVGSVFPTVARSAVAAGLVGTLWWFVPTAPVGSGVSRVLNCALWSALAASIYLSTLFLLRAPELSRARLLVSKRHAPVDQWQHVESKEE